jgi:hypothetical protein
MAKLTLAVAALAALSLAGTRVHAQSEQFASVDQAAIEVPVVAQPVDVQSVDVQPVDVQLVQVQSVDVQPVDVRPLVDSAVIAQAMTAPEASAPAAVDHAAPSGPSLQSSALSPRYSSATALGAHAMRRPSRNSGVGLMILGGAALITGLIIGDDAGTVIAVGGAIVGLYGLYVYLGRPSGMEHNNRIGLGYKLNTP